MVDKTGVKILYQGDDVFNISVPLLVECTPMSSYETLIDNFLTNEWF